MSSDAIKKVTQLLEAANNMLVDRLIEVISDVFVENTWSSGQCANLAFGISLYLSDNGVPHKLLISRDSAHVWVKVGRKIIDADRYGIVDYDEKSPVEITAGQRDAFITHPSSFISKYGIQLTERKISEVFKILNQQMAVRA